MEEEDQESVEKKLPLLLMFHEEVVRESEENEGELSKTWRCPMHVVQGCFIEISDVSNKN